MFNLFKSKLRTIPSTQYAINVTASGGGGEVLTHFHKEDLKYKKNPWKLMKHTPTRAGSPGFGGQPNYQSSCFIVSYTYESNEGYNLVKEAVCKDCGGLFMKRVELPEHAIEFIKQNKQAAKALLGEWLKQ